MPFYTGKSKDGSDMQEVSGAYVNPDNPNEWSSEMYPSQKKNHRQYLRVYDYMAKNLMCLNDVRDQILIKKCSLSKSDRDYVMAHYSI
jgi:hypothetical protein